jgi:hypothetical protein
MLMDLGPTTAQPATENRTTHKLIRLHIHLFLKKYGLNVITLLKPSKACVHLFHANQENLIVVF